MLRLVSALIIVTSLLVRGYSSQYLQRNNFVKYLKPGETYRFHNPNYPAYYSPGTFWRLIIRNDQPIKLVCDELIFPNSPNCQSDAMIVKDGSYASEIHRYCNRGSFDFTSRTNELIIELDSQGYYHGKFSCTVEADNCNCGWTNSVKIAGGVPTGINEFPMMAGLVDSLLQVLFCGATIINEKQLLTAAHCVQSRTTDGFAVVVGEHDVRTGYETDATVIHRVHSFLTHREYDSKTLENDIALLTVVGTIVFSERVGPICLPFKGIPNAIVGSPVTILGWGHYETSSPLSPVLQKTTVGVITNAECERWYSDLSHQQICTWTANRDSCQYDSGGPLLWRNRQTGKMVQVGIISVGSACASEVPAANTRVTSYMDWITKHTHEGVKYCQRE